MQVIFDDRGLKASFAAPAFPLSATLKASFASMTPSTRSGASRKAREAATPKKATTDPKGKTSAKPKRTSPAEPVVPTPDPDPPIESPESTPAIEDYVSRNPYAPINREAR